MAIIKGTRVRYNSTAPWFDDVQVNRAQAFGCSARLTTEDIKELGTLNIVEVIDDVPQVDVSLDANENGTNQIVGLLSNKGYGANVVAVPSGSNAGSAQLKVLDGSVIIGGHRFLVQTQTLTSTTGNTGVWATAGANGIATVACATSAPANSVGLATYTHSTNIVQSGITDVRPFKNITALDFELAKVDITVPVVQSGSGSAIQRTMYIERAFANNISLQFQSNGVATASYGMETDNKRWFLNGGANIITDQAIATAGTSFTLSKTPVQLANSNYALLLTKNGVKLTEGTDFTINAGTKTVTFTSALVATDLLKVRYASADATATVFSPNPASETPHPQLAGGLKEGNIEIYLSDDTNNRLTRVQSASLSIPLQRDQLNEIGSMYPYDRPLQLPLNVSINLEFTDSDLEMFARMAGYNISTSTTEINVQDLLKNRGLVIKLFRETDYKRSRLMAGHPDKYPIKTITVNNLIPQSENWNIQTDSNATQSFEFLAHNITISDSIA
jgi:hypothetical protein